MSSFAVVLIMPLRPQDLPEDRDQLVSLALAQAAEIDALKAGMKVLEGLVYGARSERSVTIADGQLALDLGDLRRAPPPVAANDTAGPASGLKRSGSKRNIGRLPAWLPRVDEVLEPDTKTCACCSGALHKIGEDVSEALDVVPAVIRIVRTIRPKYACRGCRTGVVQSRSRGRLFDGGMATTSLIASIACWKYAWHLPLSRQAHMLRGQGVRLDRSTLCRWIKRAAWWLKPLYLRQLELIHQQPRLFCDETRLPVRRKGRRRTHTGQFWAHAVDDRPWGGPAHPAVIYVFAEGRSAREIREQLKDYAGLLQVDGYAAYKGLAHPNRKPGPVTLAFCLAHARRKFFEAHKTTGSNFCADVLGRIAQIYAIEADVRGQDAAIRLAARRGRTAPILEALRSDLDAELEGLSKQSGLSKAIRYTLAHWTGLTRFLEDGRLEVDNNTVERTMRSISLGRKNHLFAGDDGGAESWAILASLLNTAKLNDLDPFVWLNDVLERMVSGAVKANELDSLLAWNWKAERLAPLQAAA